MSQAEPDDTAIRQMLLNDCDNYIHNGLPTYLLDISRIQGPTDRIRLSDIKLVSRNQISTAILTQVESDLRAIPHSGRDKWCKVGRLVVASLKSLTRADPHARIQVQTPLRYSVASMGLWRAHISADAEERGTIHR